MIMLLDELYGLPSDPDQSEDDEESDEEQITYNPTKLQRILENLNEPELRSNDTIRASPRPSTSSDEPGLWSIELLSASLSLQPSTSSASLPISTYSGRNKTTQPSTDSSESESYEDEDTWKKNSWNSVSPQPDTFECVPMTPTRMLPANARPICYFEPRRVNEIASTMPYKRFKQILRCLNPNDNSKQLPKCIQNLSISVTSKHGFSRKRT